MAHHQSNKPKDGAGEGCGPGQQPAGAAAYRLLLAEAGPASFAAIAEPAGWSGPQSSSRLLKLIRRLRPKPSPQKRLLLVVPFPVAGVATWSNDWHAFRPCPYPHLHTGLDIFAPRGTPVVSPFASTVTQKVITSMSGLAVEVTDGGRAQYFFAHLESFAARLHIGQRIAAGQVLGYVGNTGDARGTPPHLHFEVQPGGRPVPPKPNVDRWLREAERRVKSLLARRSKAHANAASTAPRAPRPFVPDVEAAMQAEMLFRSVPVGHRADRDHDTTWVAALVGAMAFPAAGLWTVRSLRRRKSWFTTDDTDSSHRQELG